MTETQPALIGRDQADRDAITADLDSTLFVEAGAGSGKTTALVARVLALLDHGVALENIAAITFTEKAADELKNRLRRRLSHAGKHPEALEQLDGAAITTLHGFALRILSQHAIEAGLPPQLEVSPFDTFEDRWADSLSRLLHSPEYQQPLVLGRILGISINHLHDLAQALDDSWDLVGERMDVSAPPAEPLTLPDISGFAERFQAVADLADYCRSHDDKMLSRLQAVGEQAELLRGAEGDDQQTLALLVRPGLRFSKAGRMRNWPDQQDGLPTLSDVARRLGDLGDAVAEAKQQVTEAVIERLALVLGAFTLEAAEDRRQRGVLEFHDLLVMARNLLRHPRHGPGVRAALSERYQRMLLDEFQDTDPIQIDLAKLIAAPPEDGGEWTRLQDQPGHLFYVGDPKQSIYRFRRADIAVFAEAGSGPTVRRKSLNRNFRTVKPIIDWINDLFDGFMVSPEPDQQNVQPLYEPLDPVRGEPPTGAPVVVMNTEHPPRAAASELRHAEAEDVAQAVLTAVGQGWSVGDGQDEHGDERWRPARLEDICILLPTRTSLAQLQPALERHDIPHRIEAGSLIWSSRAIRDVMAIVRSAADPTDEVNLLNALRSGAFGCGDDDLYAFRVAHGGRWDFLASPPPSLPADCPVAEAMGWLAGLHHQIRWLSPSGIIERIVADRRLMESGCFASPRPRDVWRSLQVVADQARQFEEAGGGGVREFIAWVDRKVSERTRESDVILSETDDNAVRITTVHAAKGREFPIVILSGTYARPRAIASNVVWPAEGGFGVRFTNSLLTKTFAEHRAREEQMEEAERVRLLYVALTRARDHLVVSAHRVARLDHSTAKLTMADLVVQHAASLPDIEWQPGALPTGDTASAPSLSYAEWQAERDASLAQARRPPAISGSAVSNIAADAPLGSTTGDPKDFDDCLSGEDRRTWRRAGRGGTQIGKAVHGVLQTVDLRTDGERLGGVVDAQAAAEGVPQAKPTIRALAKSALESNAVREAAASEHWKELFVAAPVEGVVVEGYVDLLYRTDEGLVVVDYKTDDIHDDEAFQAKIDRYKLQVAAYSLALERTVGEKVARSVLVFSQAGQAAEEVAISGGEFDAARQEVLRRLASDAA